MRVFLTYLSRTIRSVSLVRVIVPTYRLSASIVQRPGCDTTCITSVSQERVGLQTLTSHRDPSVVARDFLTAFCIQLQKRACVGVKDSDDILRIMRPSEPRLVLSHQLRRLLQTAVYRLALAALLVLDALWEYRECRTCAKVDVLPRGVSGIDLFSIWLRLQMHSHSCTNRFFFGPPPLTPCSPMAHFLDRPCEQLSASATILRR